MSGNVSNKTRNNWLIDAALFISAVVASVSGIYFLFFPTGGFRGGRNPFYGITILFDRHTWDDLHTWTGIAMIVAAVVHLAIHWRWVVGMLRRVTTEIFGRCECLNPKARFNVFIDGIIGMSFLICAVSGVYFFFFPADSNPTGWLISASTWDLLHTWSGNVMIIAGIVHFYIHWNWMVKVTRRILNEIGTNLSLSRPTESNWVKN